MTERLKDSYENFYDISNVIGNGAFGIVYKGKEKKNNKLRAIKIIDLQKIKEHLINEYDGEYIKKNLELCVNDFITEFNNMKICSTNSENSVKCYEYFHNKNNFAIIMELCDTNLSKVLTNRIIENGKGFSSEEILEILNQLNNVFKIMEENKIIHRDLKLENILVKYKDKENKNYIIKLSDFGCSKRLSSLTKNYVNTNVGTLPYMAPEIIKGEEYNYKCDLWSIGIIIYKLYFGKFPYNGMNELAVGNKIENLGNKILKKTDNEDLDDLIMKLLEKDPIKRINWELYFNHSFFGKNKIRLIYECTYDDNWNILEKFVENNKNNIELIINGKKSELVKQYKLKDGKNNIEIIIKNNIINLEYMFYECSTLKNIEGLKYLDTKEIQNFSGIFSGCSILSDLKPIEHWNVSKGNNFSNIFQGCSSLTDLTPIEKWDVYNGNNFSYMFYRCSSLSDLKPIENWNVSNGNNFSGMFFGCWILIDLKPLEKWNVSKGNYFSGMFCECSSLSDLRPIENWNVSNGNSFSYMFGRNWSLSDLKPIEKWNVSKGYNFSGMFKECSSLSDLRPIENWNVSNGNNFSGMFKECSSLSDLKPIGKWNVSNGKNFSGMFRRCTSLCDLKPIENWNVSNGNNFSGMFSGCSSLLDLKPIQNWNVSKYKLEDIK